MPCAFFAQGPAHASYRSATDSLCLSLASTVGPAAPIATGKWLHGVSPVLCRGSCILRQHACYGWWECQPSTHQLPESQLQMPCLGAGSHLFIRKLLHIRRAVHQVPWQGRERQQKGAGRPRQVSISRIRRHCCLCRILQGVRGASRRRAIVCKVLLMKHCNKCRILRGARGARLRRSQQYTMCQNTRCQRTLMPPSLGKWTSGTRQTPPTPCPQPSLSVSMLSGSR